MKRNEPALFDKMRSLASDGHPQAYALRQRADELETAVVGKPSAKQILGAWARARRLWCECTGEPLI